MKRGLDEPDIQEETSPSRDVVLTCSGPCMTRAVWNNGHFEVWRQLMTLGRSACLRPENWGRGGERDLIVREKEIKCRARGWVKARWRRGMQQRGWEKWKAKRVGLRGCYVIEGGFGDIWGRVGCSFLVPRSQRVLSLYHSRI